MKKALSVLLALAMLFASSCADETNTVSSEAPVSSKSPVSSGQPGFHLESLPDIGEYAGVKPTYFYGEPLDEFRPSDEYGTLVPYAVGGWYGFLSVDGRIITSACYPVIDTYTSFDGSRSVYVLPLTHLFPAGTAWDDRYGVLSPYAIIPADGSRCTVTDTVTTEMLIFSDASADLLLFFGDDGVEIRGLDGNRITFLSGVSPAVELSNVVVRREGEVYRLYYTDEQRNADFSVCTFDGKTQSIRDVNFDKEGVDFLLHLHGDTLLAVGSNGYVLSDLNGHVLFATPDDAYYYDVCRRADGSYVAATDRRVYLLAPDGTLTKTAENPNEDWVREVRIDEAAEEVRFGYKDGTVIYSLRDDTFSDDLSSSVSFEIVGEKGSLSLRRSDGKEVTLGDWEAAWVDHCNEAFVLVEVDKESVGRYLVYDADTLAPVAVPSFDGAKVEIVRAAGGAPYYSCEKNGVVTVLDEMFQIVGVVPVTVTD